MSSPVIDSHLKEAAALTRAVESVMRKFVRLLIGRMSLTRFQELVRLVFVQEAEAFLRRERPGKNVPMTKLALLTGLDTRTLGKVQNVETVGGSMAQNQEFLKGFLPSFRVLDMWRNNKLFTDAKSGLPKELPIVSGKDSFEQLVTMALTSRGITYTSILDRLVLNKIVLVDESKQTVELASHSPTFLGTQELDMLDIGLSSISHLVSTVSHNIECADGADDRFFQRGLWSYKLKSSDRSEFRKAMTDFLKSASDDAKDAIEPYEQENASAGMFTAGVSMYYFEGEIDK